VTTLGRLLALASVPRKRVALAVLLGTLTIVFGVGLMATAGYLISRAAERPAILSLTVAIVAVRFFGLARPLARYLERLSSHDVAFRALARARGRVYERIEPLAPAELRGDRRGDLLSRLVADVDSLQNLHLRGIGPPLVALAAGAVSVAVAAAVLPGAGAVLAAGLLVAGVGAPAAVVALSRHGDREAAARGELTAELVEALAGGAEIAAYGRQDDCLRRLYGADGRLVRLARRAALGDGTGDGLRLAKWRRNTSWGLHIDRADLSWRKTRRNRYSGFAERPIKTSKGRRLLSRKRTCLVGVCLKTTQRRHDGTTKQPSRATP